MRLTNQSNYGRFKHKETGRSVNIKKGRNMARGTDHLFYLFRGERIFISWGELEREWVKVFK